jgi:tRNA-binding EMAP/Myf-like protein
MKLSISENSDPNYLASVVKLGKIREHSNAQNLMLTTVFGNQVIISKTNYEGELMVYFPIESTISAKYLAWANMFDDVALNADDKAPKGYFSKKRRVKPAKLRGEVSNGIVISAAKIAEFFGIDISNFQEGINFDTVNGERFVEKYVPQITKQGEPGEPGKKGSKDLGITKLLLPNQFKFHSKTTQLGQAVHTVRPSDHVSITSKLHGTSAVFSNVLCRTVPTWKEKIAKFFGVRIVEEEYKFVYSSRSVVKNRRDGTYTNDVWGQWAEALEPKLPAGFTIYGEIVGYTNNGRAIQKNYAYGLPLLTNNLYVYRVTYTDKVGNTLEFDWQQVNEFCEQYNLDPVPTYFHGKASDLFDIDSEDENWNEKFLEKLKETYLEKPCELCNTGIVREGICFRRENTNHKNAWKLKSFAFLQAEAVDRDNDVTNIEEES